MRKKLLFFRNGNLFSGLVMLLLFTWLAGGANATTYYWVGGSGNWVTTVGTNHWALSSGGTPLSLATPPPTVNDDVIFDVNSGFSSGNSTMLFTNSTVVRNITVSGCVVAPSFSFPSTSQFFDIYGNADFQSGMNFTNFLCKTRFFSTPTSLNKTIQTNGNIFYGPWKVDAGSNASAATITINGNFSLRNGFEINALNNIDKVVITGTPNFIASGYNPYPTTGLNLNVVKGEIYFENGFDGYTGSSYQFLVEQNGKLFSKSNGSVYGLHNSGYMNLNYAGTNPQYSVSVASHYNTTTGATLDIHGTTIQVYEFWNYGSGSSGSHALIANGSLINFKSTATAFYTYDYTFGSVTVEPAILTFNVYGSVYGISNITPAFDNFVIKRNTYYNQPAAPTIFTFTSNTYKVDPGITVSMQYAIAKIKVNTTCDITGTCEAPIKFVNTNFEFVPGTTVLSNHILTEGITASGPATPYNPGTESRVISGTSSGWNFTVSSGRTLIWVGPIPSDIANQNTYALWSQSANWRDKAVDPGATGPGFVGGTPACPPTFRDSVIIPNNSYINTTPVGVTGVIYSSGVHFIGTNRIYGLPSTEWEIFAGLTFSPNTTNSFFGTVHFRNDKAYECKIATRNVPFQFGVIMRPVNASANWRLTDGDLIAMTMDPECDDNWPAVGSFSFRIYNGHLHTGLTNCSNVGSYNMRLWGGLSTGGTMSWYGSDIIITRQFDYTTGTLNCGISHLKLSPPLNNGVDAALGYQTYYKVSFLSPGGGGYTMSMGTNGILSGMIDYLYIDPNFTSLSSYVALAGTPALPIKIRKARIDATDHIFGVSWGPIPTYIGQIDSLILSGNSKFNQRLSIRSYVQFTAGKQYTFYPGSSPAIQMDLLGPTSAASYSTCVPLPTSYTGAMTNFNGTCSQFINIDNGIFNTSSPHAINGQYLNIKNNQVTGGTGFNANGVLTSTSGWNISVSPPRKLRWVDNSALVNNIGDWNDPGHWEQILPSYAMAPQCPPTKVDTVIFDNGSFPQAGQAFRVNSAMEVASMYWENSGANTPRLLGTATISIYGSLKLPPVNPANFMTGSTSNFEFRGIPTAQFPSFTIRTNGQRIRGNGLFYSASDNARWDLQDSLALVKFTLNRGKFYSNGFPILSIGLGSGFHIIALNATDLRTMDITNSNIWTVYGSGAPWNVINSGPVTNTTIHAGGSDIYVGPEAGGNGTFRGGGYKYHNVYMKPFGSSGWPATMGVTNGDEFDYIEASAAIIRIVGGPNLKAKRVKTLSPDFTLSSTLSIIDTMELLGASNKILSSNRFRDIFEVAPGTTFISGANEVQWFDNDCPVNLLGTSSANIQMYSSVTNVPSYLRKDSATVCADYIYIKDIWGIGNGNNPGLCNTYAQSNVNTSCAPSPANTWIVSTCDTITDDASSCGPWKPTQAMRGRAAFTAGSYADNQSGNAGWDYRPYPPVPSIVLATSSPSICVGQSVPLTISGVGAIPFSMNYTDNHGNTYYVDITSVAQLSSYNTTTNAFTYSTTVSPTTSTTYSAGVIAIERCFNNISPAGTGNLAITVNPYPQINNAVTATDVCSGNVLTITPSTTIPATINWTSTSYSGVSGHGTSGVGTITETMTTSNASPTSVVYTLTPTANGCTGTPVNFTVNLNPRPNVVPGAAQTLDCNTSTAVVSASSSTAGVQFGWTGPGIVSGTSTNAATVNAAGTYSVLVTNPVTGCTSSASVAVSFLPDTQNPTITCPSNLTAAASASSCDASVVTPNPTVNDNCGVTRLTWALAGATAGNSPSTGINYVGTRTFNTGLTTVTYTIQDAVGNTTTCSYTVTITDNTLPVITCPANITAYTTSASCNRSVATPNPAFSDNCGVTRLTWAITGATTGSSPASGINYVGTQTFNLGNTTVTYTAFDAAGNVATCSYTVSVSDTIDPTINCPAAMNGFTNAASCSASLATPNPLVADNCSITLQIWAITGATTGSSPASGIHNLGTYTFNSGISTVTYTVSDESGNTSSCSYTVTITDNIAPIISCPGNLASNTNAGVCTASVTNPNPAVSDNCTVTRVSYIISGATSASSPASGINYVGSQTFNLGVSTITYTIGDAAGNTSTCSYTVTVTDNQFPTVICPANIMANTTSTTCDASVSIPTVTYGDNCTVSALTWTMTGATVAASSSSGINQVGTQTFNSGVTTITYTVRDASNNVSTCSFTVTITDLTPPVVPVLPVVSGQCAATAPVPVANDNCSGFVNGTTPDPLTYNTQGTFTIHWTFTDAAGNVSTANQTVIVDNSLPPTPPVLATLVGECLVIVPIPSATTGCSGTVLGTTSDPLVYNNQGTYTITWTFDDGMGNVVTTTQTVIVDDITDPVTPTVPSVSDECSVILTAPTTMDNCAGIITGTTSNPTSYSTQGTFNVVWNFNDGNGNTTNVIQTVTIADVTAPTFSNCPAAISVFNDPGDCGADVFWTPPVANDNCIGYTVTSSHNPGDFFNLGMTTVTYTVTDVAGNTSTCTFVVEVTDHEAPVISACPANISVPNDPSTCGAIVTWTLPVPADNCPGVTIVSTHDSGDLFTTGTTTVTYTATDASGNTSTCTFNVTVTDMEAPVFATCPSDITINNDAGICGAVVNWVPMTATDNCSTVTITGSHNPGDQFPVGTTTVSYVATDNNGNSITCSFDVTVVDAEVPVLSGLTDLSVCEGSTVNWNVTATDNCAVQSLTSNYTSGTTFSLGNTWVVYTAVDASGNIVIDSFMVNVFASAPVSMDLQPNTDLCIGNAVVLNILNPVAGATYTWEFNGTVIGTGTELNLSDIQITQNGTYNVVSDLPGGCVSYGSINVEADFCDLIIPEAVTPNADGNNDTWYIENLENYPNTTVQIVNRWGAVVFESEDYKNDWDGTSQNKMNIGGDDLPEGTFYYVLVIGGDSSSKFYHKVFTGYIYLKRN